MSDFFQQLIARQQGQTETAQPLIPSRFGQVAQPTPEGGFAADVQPSEAITEMRETEMPELSRTAQPASSQAPFSQSPTVEFEPQPSASRSDPAPTARQVFTTEARAISRLETVTRWIEETAEVSRPAAARSEVPLVNPFQQSDRRAETPTEDSVERPSVPPPASPAIAPPLSRSEPVSPLTAPAEATPISPAVPARFTIAPSASVRPQQPVSPVSLQPMLQPMPLLAAPAAPTIQVAIGRVEIRATPAKPTPAPRRTTSVRQPPMSLEQYLQQRSREG